MASLRICVTDQRPVVSPTKHAHIVAVGTGDNPDRPDSVWTLAQVVSSIRHNTHTFWTWSYTHQKWAGVSTFTCGYCIREHIRSNPDAAEDNNLENLPRRVLI